MAISNQKSGTYLVRESKGELDLVRHGFGVAPALEGHAGGQGGSPEGRASKSERAHLAMDSEKIVVIYYNPLSLLLLRKVEVGLPVILAAGVTWSVYIPIIFPRSQIPTVLSQYGQHGHFKIRE